MKLEKIRIFISQFDLGNPLPKLFFQDANFLPAALTIRVRSHERRNELIPV